MQFRVLGPLEAQHEDGAPVDLAARKPAALLAVLLLNANAWVSVHHLIAAIWHEQAVPASAIPNLRSYVCQLRRELGDRLDGRPGAYRIRVADGELDVDRVDALAESAEAALATGAFADAADGFAAALGVWRGTPFDGHDFDEARAAASTWADRRRELGVRLADAQLAAGRTVEATTTLRALTERHPLCEPVWARLLRALHHDGRPAEALAAYEQVRKIMVEELGVEPGAELAAVRQEIAPARAHRPRLLPDVEPNRRVARSRSTGQLSLVGGTTPPPAPAGLDALLAGATREVLIMCDDPGSGPVGILRKIDHDNIRRGVRYRVLGPDSARLSGALNAMSLAGAEVRTDVEVPMAAIVIDGTAAVLPADRASTGSRSGVAVFQLPGVVTATVGLFDRIWPSAVPLTPTDLAQPAHESGLSQRERELLALLCAGCTDESAGARLGISVRTVRRTVADIMNRLGARSRFQAGVKAADRGWLMDKAG